MALNNLGLGFVISAKNLASAVFADVRKELSDLAKDPEKLKASLEEAGSEMKKASLALMGIGAAGFAGLGVAARESVRFEKAVAEVASIADKAEFPLTKIADLSKDMASTFGGDPAEHAKSLYNAISSGATTAAQATDLLNTANKLAIGGLTDINSATKALTTVFNTGIKGADDFTKISDALFQTVNLGQGEMSELAAVIGNVAPTAAAFGVNIDELSAAMAAGSLKLGTFAKTADGLQEVLSNIAKPTSAAEKEAKKLGISFDIAGLKSKGLAGLLNEVAAKSKNPTESFNELFGSTTALKTVLALMGDDAKLFNADLKAMADKAGSTDNAFKTLSQTAEFAQSVFQGNLKTALINIGDAIAPLIGKTLALANAFLKWFNGLPKPVFKAVAAVVALVSSVFLLGGAAIGLTGVVLGLVAVGKVALITFAAMIAIFSGVGLAIAAVGLAAYGLYDAVQRNVGGIGTFFADLYAKGKLLMDALGQLFTQGGFSGAVLDELNKGNKGVKDFAITVYLWANRVLGFFDGVKQGVTNAIASAGPVLRELQTAFNGLLAAFGFAKDAPDEAGKKFDAFASAGQRLGDVIGSAFTFLVKAITAGIEVGRGFVLGLRQMQPVFNQVWAAIQNVIGAFTSMSASTGQQTSGFETLGKVVSYVVGAVAATFSVLANLFAFQATIVTSAISGIIGVFGGLKSVFEGVWNIISGILTGNWSKVWMGVVQVVAGAVQTIISLVASVVSAIAGIGDIVGKIAGKDLGLKALVEGAKNDALKAVAQGPGQIAQDAVGLVKGTPTTQTPAGLVQPPAAVQGLPIAGMGSTTPAAAAGGVAGAQTGALDALAKTSAAPPPISLESKTILTLDGEVIAQNVQKHQQTGAARGFAPVPSPA